jgi:hypothetical protein
MRFESKRLLYFYTVDIKHVAFYPSLCPLALSGKKVIQKFLTFAKISNTNHKLCLIQKP